jgi:hypothetical protein
LEKNISILAKASQVSDVAHGPLVLYVSLFFSLLLLSPHGEGD